MGKSLRGGNFGGVNAARGAVAHHPAQHCRARDCSFFARLEE